MTHTQIIMINLFEILILVLSLLSRFLQDYGQWKKQKSFLHREKENKNILIIIIV